MTAPPETERDEIEALLPWYVTGGLSASETRRVEVYLAAHPEAAASFDAAREEAEATVALNEAAPEPGRADLDALMSRIAAESKQAAARSAGTQSFVERVGDWLANLTSAQLGLAAGAAVVLAVAQAAAIGGLMVSRPAVYETASDSSGDQKSGAELLVGFAPEATIADASALLKDTGAVVVDGPRAGYFRIRVDAAALASAMDKLKGSRIVTAVLPGR